MRPTNSMKLLSKQLLIDFKNNRFDLGKIDKELRTLELCIIAVQQNGYELDYVPQNLRTRDCAQLQFNKMVMRYNMFLKNYEPGIVHNCNSTKWLCIATCL